MKRRNGSAAKNERELRPEDSPDATFRLDAGHLHLRVRLLRARDRADHGVPDRVQGPAPDAPLEPQRLVADGLELGHIVLRAVGTRAPRRAAEPNQSESIAARTSAAVGCVPKPVRHQVAPAAAHGSGSSPGGFVTTTS